MAAAGMYGVIIGYPPGVTQAQAREALESAGLEPLRVLGPFGYISRIPGTGMWFEMFANSMTANIHPEAISRREGGSVSYIPPEQQTPEQCQALSGLVDLVRCALARQAGYPGEKGMVPVLEAVFVQD